MKKCDRLNCNGVYLVDNWNAYAGDCPDCSPKQPQEAVSIEGWIAKYPKSGTVFSTKEIHWYSEFGEWLDDYMNADEIGSLPDNSFPDLTFENSPRKIQLSIRLK